MYDIRLLSFPHTPYTNEQTIQSVIKLSKDIFIMAQYADNQGHSHTWHAPVATDAESFDSDTVETSLGPVTSFSGMPNVPSAVTWPKMPETMILYTGQPNSRGRYPRWRPHIETPNAYSGSFNPETEENNCFFDTAGSIVGLSSVGFCEFIGYERDHDVGVTAEGEYCSRPSLLSRMPDQTQTTEQTEIIKLFNKRLVVPLRRYSLSATELALVNYDWGVRLSELQRVAERHFSPWSGDDNDTFCIGVRIGYYINGKPGVGHWITMRKLAQEQYVENTDETNAFAVRTVTSFTWHVQDHQQNGREDWLTKVLAPKEQPYIMVTALLGFAQVDNKEKKDKGENSNNNKKEKKDHKSKNSKKGKK